MKKLLFLTAITVMTFTACNKLDIEKGTSACIENKIKDFSKNAVCKDPKVEEYLFQNKNVYVFYQGSCGADMTSDVYDSDCNSMGSLGGIAGNKLINGEEFSNAVFIKTTWEK
ncbi:MAG: hypothetical protein V1904_09350 [Bacteroidota bacterium]